MKKYSILVLILFIVCLSVSADALIRLQSTVIGPVLNNVTFALCSGYDSTYGYTDTENSIRDVEVDITTTGGFYFCLVSVNPLILPEDNNEITLDVTASDAFRSEETDTEEPIFFSGITPEESTSTYNLSVGEDEYPSRLTVQFLKGNTEGNTKLGTFFVSWEGSKMLESGSYSASFKVDISID